MLPGQKIGEEKLDARGNHGPDSLNQLVIYLSLRLDSIVSPETSLFLCAPLADAGRIELTLACDYP